VCYDNGCNLSAYVAARCPDIAAKVKFIIDRLHSRNHTHCSIAFQLDRYAFHTRALDFNTQRVEQLNRMLRRLATHLRFSRPDHGIDTLRVFMMLFAFQRHQNVSGGVSVDVVDPASSAPLFTHDGDDSATVDEDLAALVLSSLADGGSI